MPIVSNNFLLIQTDWWANVSSNKKIKVQDELIDEPENQGNSSTKSSDDSFFDELD